MPAFKAARVSEIRDEDGQVSQVGEYRVNTRPLGFRGTRGLSWLLRKVPYITGGVPRFRLNIKHLSRVGNESFSYSLQGHRPGEAMKVLSFGRSQGPALELEVEDEWVTRNGDHKYVLRLSTDIFTETSVEVVNFQALYQETVTITVFVTFSGIITALLGVIVGWLLSTLVPFG